MTEVITTPPVDESNALVMLSAESWCVPCRQFAPVFAKAAEQHDGDIKFYKIDVDENPDTATHYNVSSVPTIIRFKDGEQTPITERKPLPFLRIVESFE